MDTPSRSPASLSYSLNETQPLRRQRADIPPFNKQCSRSGVLRMRICTATLNALTPSARQTGAKSKHRPWHPFVCENRIKVLGSGHFRGLETGCLRVEKAQKWKGRGGRLVGSAQAIEISGGARTVNGYDIRLRGLLVWIARVVWCGLLN